LVGEYVSLRKAGVNHVGLCPFHGEKTPSFNVNPARKIFYCFGCQEGGDAIKFLQKIEGLSFPEATARLANRAGVILPEEPEDPKKQQQKSHEKALLDVNRASWEYFQEVLKSVQGQRAQEYLENRGVSPDCWERHGLGYAPDRWDGLL